MTAKSPEQELAEREEAQKKEEEEKQNQAEEEQQKRLEELKKKKEETLAAVAASPSPQSQSFPAGWEQVIDPSSGKTYYFNRSTGEAAWTPPTQAGAVAPPT